MRHRLRLTPLLLLVLICPALSYAQETAGAQQSVESLRSQLQDIEAKQAALEERMRQLDEDLRPENIERSLRLTGSTRPEELREQRRRQLEKEKAGLQSQLDQLATSRSRLQSALATAETAAYQQSANVSSTTTTAATATAPTQAAGSGRQAQTARPAQPDSKRRRARRNRVRRRTP